MNKTLFYFHVIIFLIISFSTETFGQRKKRIVGSPLYQKEAPKTHTIDSGKIKIWYAFCATDIKNTKTYDDLQILEIGDRHTKYYSWFKHNSDSLITDYLKRNPSAQVVPINMGPIGKDDDWSEYYFSEYYKDNTEKTFSEYTRMPHLVRFNSYYVEPLPRMEWTIHDEEKLIAEQMCQKATCHFRGRDFIAWFTINIPNNEGPWKFGGLPGLILKVTDTNNLFDFECVKIEYRDQSFPITKFEKYKDYRKWDRKKHLEFQKKLNKDWHGTVGLVLLKGTFPPPIEYDALELE